MVHLEFVSQPSKPEKAVNLGASEATDVRVTVLAWCHREEREARPMAERKRAVEAILAQGTGAGEGRIQ